MFASLTYQFSSNTQYEIIDLQKLSNLLLNVNLLKSSSFLLKYMVNMHTKESVSLKRPFEKELPSTMLGKDILHNNVSQTLLLRSMIVSADHFWMEEYLPYQTI